jgi:hypothetical protein
MGLAADDLVRSIGRIKTIQNDRRRFIEFPMARVIDVSDAGITVNPVGKNAILLCRPDDLEVVEPGTTTTRPDPEPEFEPGSITPPLGEVEVEAGTEVTGSIAVSGTVTEDESPKPKPRAKRARTIKEKAAAEEKPKQQPRQRRRR